MLQAVSFGTHGTLLTHAVHLATNVHPQVTTIVLCIRCICWNRSIVLGKDLQLCCVAIVLFWTAYFGAIKICLGFAFATMTTDNIAVLIGPSVHAFDSLWVTKSSKRIHNRPPSVTHLWKLNADIFVIIIFFIGACFTRVFIEDF